MEFRISDYGKYKPFDHMFDCFLAKYRKVTSNLQKLIINKRKQFP